MGPKLYVLDYTGITFFHPDMLSYAPTNAQQWIWAYWEEAAKSPYLASLAVEDCFLGDCTGAMWVEALAVLDAGEKYLVDHPDPRAFDLLQQARYRLPHLFNCQENPMWGNFMYAAPTVYEAIFQHFECVLRVLTDAGEDLNVAEEFSGMLPLRVYEYIGDTLIGSETVDIDFLATCYTAWLTEHPRYELRSQATTWYSAYRAIPWHSWPPPHERMKMEDILSKLTKPSAQDYARGCTPERPKLFIEMLDSLLRAPNREQFEDFVTLYLLDMDYPRHDLAYAAGIVSREKGWT